MANFQTAAAILLDLEGGFAEQDVNNGAVNHGITADFLRRHGLPFDVVSIRNMTDDYALDLYYEYHWKPIKGDLIRSQVYANLLLATALHAGVVRAVKILQNAVEVKADGIVGPKTLAAMNASTPDVYANAILAFYRRLAVNNPNLYAHLLGGWINRLRTLVPDWSPRS